MAGYIFTLNSMDALETIEQTGVYSTRFKQMSKNHWSVNYEGTFADFLSMRLITAIEMYQSCNLFYQRVTNNLPSDAKAPTTLHITSL